LSRGKYPFELVKKGVEERVISRKPLLVIWFFESTAGVFAGDYYSLY